MRIFHVGCVSMKGSVNLELSKKLVIECETIDTLTIVKQAMWNKMDNLIILKFTGHN